MSLRRRNPPDYRMLFEAMAGSYLVLTPELNIAAISDDLARANSSSCKDMLGRYVFDVLPDDPRDPSGRRALRASLTKVLATNTADAMPIVKYSLKAAAAEGGGFIEKYWRPTNQPVFDADGRIQYILHRTEEVTDYQKSLQESEDAKQRSRNAEWRMEFALDAAQMGTWEINFKNGRIVRSLRHDQCFGYHTPQADWTVEHALRHIHNDDRHELEKALIAALRGECSLNLDFRVIWTDGTTHWISIRSRVENDQNGIATYLGGLVWLITEVKSAEQQVIDILEGMNDAFFSVDRNWCITRVNAHQERLSQIRREAQVGKSFLDIFLPESEREQSNYWRHYERVMRERIKVSFEDFYAPLALWTSVDAYPTADGGMAVFYRDITEQKTVGERVEAERHKFAAIFINSPAGMALLRGPELIFEAVNQTYADLLNGRSLLGKSMYEVLPELEGQPFFDLMQQVLATGEVFTAQQMPARFVRKVGEAPLEGYFDLTYSRVDDGNGKPYGVYIHTVESTAQVRARREIEKLAEELKESVQVRDDFLSIASHELKTPVTSLKMQLQMAQRHIRPAEGMTLPPEKLLRTLTLAIRQVDRLTALIEDLLDVSRIESGKMTYHFEPVDLVALTREVIERFEEQLKVVGCPLEITATAASAEIICDRFRIEQVITNLLTNAIKYGAGTTVRVHNGYSSSGALISVADQGIGIAEENQTNIFNRFERAVSHRSISGLGLGLYITKSIVDAHGGQITVRSCPGRGSNFTVILPWRSALS